MQSMLTDALLQVLSIVSEEIGLKARKSQLFLRGNGVGKS